MFKNKKKLSPIVTCILLTAVVILLSGFLSLLKVQAEYTTVSKVTNELVNNVVEVRNLFSLSGFKHIFTTAVSGFINFEPLPILIIVLIGIGVLEKSGFLEAFFTLLTKNTKKNTVTFILIFISLAFSLVGNIGFVIMLPLGALLFKYGRRNPQGGVIATFAALAFGTSINIFMTATDSTLITYTLKAARLIDPNYKIGTFFALFLMIVMLIVTSIIFTIITEKKIMPRLPRIDYDEKEFVITNKHLRGLIVGLGLGLLYSLVIIYMIIPNLPLSGALLDTTASKYIDMVFGAKSLFNQGFVFIVTVLFAIIGFGYGFMTKSIRSSKDVSESLSYSLDGVGYILVLMFFASLFINAYEQSNIGTVLIAFSSTILGSLNVTGSLLIIITVLVVAITNLFCTNTVLKWSILSASIVPLFMNASISPEYAQIVYSAGDAMTNGLTPLFVFFVIYIALLEKYNKSENVVTIFGSIRMVVPYSIYITIIWLVVLIGWFMIGLPVGISTLPGVIYGA